MFEAIVSLAQFAICLREKMCGIDQCSSSAALGGQHTEMFVDHVIVFSQSVSHIRLSHTIYCNSQYREVLMKSTNQLDFSLILKYFILLMMPIILLILATTLPHTTACTKICCKQFK